jgi:hypothetical protein
MSDVVIQLNKMNKKRTVGPQGVHINMSARVETHVSFA